MKEEINLSWKQRFVMGIGIMLLFISIITIFTGLILIIFHGDVNGLIIILFSILGWFLGVIILKTSEEMED